MAAPSYCRTFGLRTNKTEFQCELFWWGSAKASKTPKGATETKTNTSEVNLSLQANCG